MVVIAIRVGRARSVSSILLDLVETSTYTIEMKTIVRLSGGFAEAHRDLVVQEFSIAMPDPFGSIKGIFLRRRETGQSGTNFLHSGSRN